MGRHHNCSINDDTQRNRNAGKRIEMDLHIEQHIKDERYENICKQRKADNRQILEAPAHNKDKQQQYNQ